MAGVIAFLQSAALHHERVDSLLCAPRESVLPPRPAPLRQLRCVRQPVRGPGLTGPVLACVLPCYRRCRKRPSGGASVENSSTGSCPVYALATLSWPSPHPATCVACICETCTYMYVYACIHIYTPALSPRSCSRVCLRALLFLGLMAHPLAMAHARQPPRGD